MYYAHHVYVEYVRVVSSVTHKLLFAADPFMNDQNFVLSVLTLEEFGATGNKVSAAGISLAAMHMDRLLLGSYSQAYSHHMEHALQS